GTSVTRDSTVDILVSKGIELVVMSSYVGKSGEQALNELTDAGFDVTSDFAFSDTIATGAVISQTPDVATAGKGTKVVLVVSKGSESVFIPNIYSLTQSKATSALQDLDLKVMVKKIGKAKIKSVTNISPKVGTKVKRGSTVTITVG
ncbi:MAG: PASTA domain-containing protein, partial [Actinobacteria bacterium]|nr:PASTA domain-containing protein [Actinomycetota bacterium]